MSTVRDLTSQLSEWKPRFFQETQVLPADGPLDTAEDVFNVVSRNQVDPEAPVSLEHGKGNRIFVEVPATGRFQEVSLEELESRKRRASEPKPTRSTPWAQSILRILNYFFNTAPYLLLGLCLVDLFVLYLVPAEDVDLVFTMMDYIVVYRFLGVFLVYFTLFGYIKQFVKLPPLRHGVRTGHIITLAFSVVYLVPLLCTLLLFIPEVRLFAFYKANVGVYREFVASKTSIVDGVTPIDGARLKQLVADFAARAGDMRMFRELATTRLVSSLVGWVVAALLYAGAGAAAKDQ